MFGNAGRAALDSTARAGCDHEREAQRRGCQEYQQRQHHRRAVVKYSAQAVHRLGSQILKLTSRYMMRLPIPIHVPAIASAVLVMLSFQTLA